MWGNALRYDMKRYFLLLTCVLGCLISACQPKPEDIASAQTQNENIFNPSPINVTEPERVISKNGNSDVTYKHNYANLEYGYSVKIPNGLSALSDPPPLPQHGIEIELDSKRSARIWISG